MWTELKTNETFDEENDVDVVVAVVVVVVDVVVVDLGRESSILICMEWNTWRK